MGKWLKSVFSPTNPLVIGYEGASRPTLKMEPDIHQALIGLGGHPGFRYLCDKLDLQASYLRAKLSGERHESLREVDAIQSGIAWCGWLKAQVAQATEIANRPRHQAPLEEEMRLFRELDAQLERVTTPEVPA